MTGWLMSEFGPWLLAGVLGLISLFFARRSGRKAAETREMERRLKSVKEGKEIENEVEALTPDALRARARQWVRKP